MSVAHVVRNRGWIGAWWWMRSCIRRAPGDSGGSCRPSSGHGTRSEKTFAIWRDRGVWQRALAVHLWHRIYNGAFRAVIEQGHVVSMPSLVTVEVFDAGVVTVGGTGTQMVEGRMML